MPLTLTQIYGLSQKSDQKMGYNVTPMYCIVWMMFFIHHNANAVLQWLHQPFPLKQKFSSPDMYLVASSVRTGYIMEFGH